MTTKPVILIKIPAASQSQLAALPTGFEKAVKIDFQKPGLSGALEPAAGNSLG